MIATVDVRPAAAGGVYTPHPVQSPSPTATAASRNNCIPRRLFQPKQRIAAASAAPGSDGDGSCSCAADAAEEVTVSTADATSPEGVTGVGENLQEVPAGSPEQLKETADAKPFCGAIRTVVVALCPTGTVRDAGDTVTEKVGAAAVTT